MIDEFTINSLYPPVSADDVAMADPSSLLEVHYQPLNNKLTLSTDSANIMQTNNRRTNPRRASGNQRLSDGPDDEMH